MMRAMSLKVISAVTEQLHGDHDKQHMVVGGCTCAGVKEPCTSEY